MRSHELQVLRKLVEDDSTAGRVYGRPPSLEDRLVFRSSPQRSIMNSRQEDSIHMQSSYRMCSAVEVLSTWHMATPTHENVLRMLERPGIMPYRSTVRIRILAAISYCTYVAR